MKKTYEITFKAELTEDDVRAMNKYFYDTMNDSMQIANIWDLKLTEIKQAQTPGGRVFNHINDVEQALLDCKNIDEVNELLDNIPKKFGEWWVDVVLGSEGYYCYEVINQWWNDMLEGAYTQTYELDIPVEED